MRRIAAISIVLLGVFAACSDDSSSSSTSPTAPVTVAAVTTRGHGTRHHGCSDDRCRHHSATTTPAPTTDAAPTAAWRQVTASAECMCADGSPYSYWIHQGDPSKVVFFLQGGGACFDPGHVRVRQRHLQGHQHGPGDDPSNITTGIFDFTDHAQPDWRTTRSSSRPYCTGDVHLGTATHVYGPELTVQHKGFVDASTALTIWPPSSPTPQQLVVTGESAGSGADASLCGGLAHDLLPNADITVLADGSGAYPDVPAINSVSSVQPGAPRAPDPAVAGNAKG